MVGHLLDGLILRAALALPLACTALDTTAAEALREHLLAAHAAVGLRAGDAQSAAWRLALEQLAGLPTAHEMLKGLATRLLLDGGDWGSERVAQQLSLHLSTGAPAADAAAWLDGFLNRNAVVLLHDDAVWQLVDDWLAGLSEDHFISVLPLVRRSFSHFAAGERRDLGARAARGAATAQVSRAADWDEARAVLPLPLLRRLLGTSIMSPDDTERLRRWRLVLGSEAEAACGGLQGPAKEMDRALTALYDAQGPGGLQSQRGGRGGSAPSVARWLGDIRNYFPSQVVQVMQRDALERLNLRDMLLQPEMLNAVQPDVHLVAQLMALSRVIPAGTKDTARLVVKRVVDELMKRLDEPLRSAISGALDRSQRNRRPRHAEIDWHRTIRANLRHWQPAYRTVVPQTLVGYGRKARRPQREVVLCIDQSGSMANSVVYSSIFGAVMASLPAVATKLVVFDTAVVDMTEQLDDPRGAAVRRATGWRHRHQRRGGLLPVHHPRAAQHHPCVDLRPCTKAASRPACSSALPSWWKAVCSS